MSSSGNSGQRTDSLVSGVIGTSTVTNGSGVQMSPQAHNKFLVMLVSSYTDGTFIPKVQHSMDGIVWEDLVAGSGISANGQESVAFPVTGNLPFVRGVVTSSVVTTGATVVAFFTHASSSTR